MCGFHRFAFAISIHALRGEGDGGAVEDGQGVGNFYPRPPWGGRPRVAHKDRGPHQFLSTPSVGRATTYSFHRWQRCGFLSTPSVGRATESPHFDAAVPADFYPRPPWGGRPIPTPPTPTPSKFLSTPSVGRATFSRLLNPQNRRISIHALRGEGDGRAPAQHQAVVVISIHALRGEGDGPWRCWPRSSR